MSIPRTVSPTRKGQGATQPIPDKRVRSGFLLLLGGAVAALVLPIWLYQRSAHESSPPPGDATQEAAPAAEPVAATEPVEVAPAAPEAPAGPPTPLEEQGGIRITSIRLAMSGQMVDLRYRVTSPEKVAQLAKADNTAYLVEQASGTQIPLGPPVAPGRVPPHSRARSQALMMPRAAGFPPAPSRVQTNGQTYSVLLPNMACIVRSGSKVSFVVGNLRADNLTVE